MSASGEDKATMEILTIAVDADGLVRTKPEGVYLEEDPVLVDGEQHRLTLTVDGKLRVDIAAAGVMFTELAGGEDHQAAGDGVWENWDLSAIIGAGAKAVLVMMSNAEANHNYMGARRNGSALVRTGDLDERNSFNVRWDVSLLTECDASRIIDIISEDVSLTFFNILGYWA